MIENNVIINFTSGLNTREIAQILPEILSVMGLSVMGLSVLNREVVKLKIKPQEIVDGLLRYAVVKEIVPEGLPLLDVCASEQNKKCERFITEQQDTLVTPWGEGNLCWLSPPY